MVTLIGSLLCGLPFGCALSLEAAPAHLPSLQLAISAPTAHAQVAFASVSISWSTPPREAGAIWRYTHAVGASVFVLFMLVLLIFLAALPWIGWACLCLLPSQVPRPPSGAGRADFRPAVGRMRHP